MSFGVYRPALGVGSGMRQLASDKSMQEQRVIGERNGRQAASVNPITGEVMGGAPAPAPAPRRPPSGNLSAGLVPSSGPLDPMTVPNKDVSGKRVDPSRNQAPSFHGGAAFMVPKSDELPQRVGSRLTEGNLEMGEAGFGGREPTPERRTTPGQVVRSGLRPKDSLSGGGCVTSDKQDHPLGLPRKAGSGIAGTGSGGYVHLVPGPNGFVPAGPGYEDDFQVQPKAHTNGAQSNAYKPLWGGV
mmetsp:Transcript_26453/g.47747  ORF Transcript_26453/g.47747 Transcript_26453/m.47747 type:complete len:243 (-) Transcript_26453:52-780(-)